MNVWAGSWLIASVYIDLTMQMLSAMRCMCGSRSLIQVPCWPQGRPDHMGATTGKWAWPLVMPVIRCVPFTDGGRSLPWFWESAGLLSKRSTWEKPSLWKRQRTRLALGVKCGRPGNDAEEALAEPVAPEASASWRGPRSALSAVLPIVAPAVAPRKVRRVARDLNS